MKLAEALEISKGPVIGYRVIFEHVEGCILRSDYFPDKDEQPLPTAEDAWTLAQRFAVQTRGRCVNIYVADQSWNLVPRYRHREIENR
jgi:hypothetical protein